MAPTVRMVGDVLVFAFRYDAALNTALRAAAEVRWDAGRKAFTLRVGRLGQVGAVERLGRFLVEAGFEPDAETRTLLGLPAPAGLDAASAGTDAASAGQDAAAESGAAAGRDAASGGPGAIAGRGGAPAGRGAVAGPAVVGGATGGTVVWAAALPAPPIGAAVAGASAGGALAGGGPAGEAAVLGPGRLRADLLPTSTWGSNLRGVFTAEEWDALRIPVCTAAGNRCEVCAAETLSRGRRRRPDCHELWAFDHDRGVQRLVRLIALCPDCHRVQHAGLAQVKGETPLVVEKLRAVNGWTVAQTDRELDRAWAEYQRRERRAWDLDLSTLRGTVTVEGYPELYIRAAERDLLGNSFHPA